MEDVAANQDELGSQLDRATDGRLKGARNIRFPLVDATGCETLVLSKAEVQVRKVDETHSAGAMGGDAALESRPEYIPKMTSMAGFRRFSCAG
jgi:hypothetical protein